jgi:hypothetical protein
MGGKFRVGGGRKKADEENGSWAAYAGWSERVRNWWAELGFVRTLAVPADWIDYQEMSAERVLPNLFL